MSKELINTIKKYYDASDQEAERIVNILNSSSYKRADFDHDFLDSDLARPLRLQLEYTKVQSVLEEKGVDKTIVIFGGTRVVQQNRAEIKLKKAKDQLKQDPENTSLQHNLKIANNTLRKVKYYEEAESLAAKIVQYNLDNNDNLYVMTGGGPGVMEAANKGAYDKGAESIGLNIDLPFEQFPNPYITPELCFSFRYFALRKLHFMNKAKALVAFPGGFGTFDELFEALTVIQTKTIKPIPVILVGENYWNNAVNFKFLADEGVISPADLNLFKIVETAEQAWDSILEWYENNNLEL